MTKKLTDQHLRILEKAEIECSDVEALLFDYVEGELSQSLAGRLSAHIEDCPHCQESEGSYRFVIELASELQREEDSIPTDVQNRLRSGLNQRLGLKLSMVEDRNH